MPLSSVKDLFGYLKSYGAILGRKAIKSLDPLHVPGRDPLPSFDEFLRPLFEAQQHVCTATIKMLGERGGGFVAGECGVGKTIIAMAAYHLKANGQPYRACVLCPDHLIGKWEEEIKITIPDAAVIRFSNIKDVLALFDDGYTRAKRVKGKKISEHREEVPVSVGSINRKSGMIPWWISPNEGPGCVEMRAPATKPNTGVVAQDDMKVWTTPIGPTWYVLGRNQVKWDPEWLGIGEKKKIFREKGDDYRARENQSSKKKAIKWEDVYDEYGNSLYVWHGPRKGYNYRKPITDTVFWCPSCGNLIMKKGKRDEYADAKMLAKKKMECEGLYLLEVRKKDSTRTGPLDKFIPEYGLSNYREGQVVTWKHGYGRYQVTRCKQPLWQWTHKAHRWAWAKIIQKKMRNFFDYLVIDEVHEQKSDESARSMAAGKFIGVVPNILALTGTIIGGYANHLYPLMLRITPRSLRAEGFEWGKDKKFNEAYGRVDTIETSTSDIELGDVSIGKGQKSMKRKRERSDGKISIRTKVVPGVMPTMFGRHMIGTSVFLALEELSEELPDLVEYVGGPLQPPPEKPEDMETNEKAALEYAADLAFHEKMAASWFDCACEMDRELELEYMRIESILTEACKMLLRNGSMKLLGTMLHTLLNYPDHPYGWNYNPELAKAIAASGPGKEAPPLLGQSFLKQFKFEVCDAAPGENGTISMNRILTLRRDGLEDRIPLEHENGIYKLDVKFGSITKSMCFDTGASLISMSEAMAKEIGWKPRETDYNTKASIADGSVVSCKRTKIDSVTIGKFTVEDVDATIDAPGAGFHTVGFWREPKVRLISNWVGIVTPRELDSAKIRPKEKKLVEICKAEKKLGRQVWVYCQMTRKKDVQPRLKALLEAEGLKVKILRSETAKPIEREQWIKDNGIGVDVMISFPSLVETGLDLFSKADRGHNFASIIFYETGYNTFTMRQASRRAWRLAQPLDCKIYYLHYVRTMQQKALELASRKLLACSQLEGDLTADGLQALGGDDNEQMAMAKALSEKIDPADMQRNWNKIGSKRKTRDVKITKTLAPPSKAQHRDDALALVEETINEQEMTAERMRKLIEEMTSGGLSLDDIFKDMGDE